jgi:hypothetical protein
MTPHNPARPCSSLLVPNPGDDHKSSWSSIVPHPTGTTSTTESNNDHPKTTSSSITDRTTTRQIIGPRSTPAWDAAINYLDDDQWHPIPELLTAMLDASDLSRRTVQNYLASASRRGWVRRKRGKVKIRDRHALDAALDSAR